MKSTKILSLILVGVIGSSSYVPIIASAQVGECNVTTNGLESEYIEKRSSLDSFERVEDIVRTLNGEYTLVSDTLCGRGAHTIVYPLLGKDGKRYVLKISKQEENTPKFMEEKIHTNNLLKEIFCGYTGEVEVPFVEKFGEDYVIEKCMGGSSLLKCYHELPEEEKREIGEKIAQFILYLSEKGLTGNLKEYTSIYDNEKQKDILKNYFINNRSELAERFEKRDIADEIETWALVDLHLDNIMYDKETKQLSVIDLDGIRKDCIYRNFLPKSISCQDGLYDFMNMVISCINEHKPGTISKEKFELFYEAEDEAIIDVCFY